MHDVHRLPSGQRRHFGTSNEESPKFNMAFSDSISRLTNYYRRHGLTGTVRRTKVFLRRFFSSNRLVIFYYDLSRGGPISSQGNWPDHITVVRIKNQEEIDHHDWQKIMEFWNPELSRRNFSNRFREGASVWLVHSKGKLAGFGWSLIGRPIKTHFFPFGPNDVHLFDFLVFPEFRGKGFNPFLVTHILDRLGKEGGARAFIEAAESNLPQLRSLGKTGFHFLGVASRVSVFGRTYVKWGKLQVPSESGNAQVSAKIRI
jgi:ribosomal protein S18 acetylase RimI-like enzyme